MTNDSKLNDSNYSITTEELELEEKSLGESVDSIGNNGKKRNSISHGTNNESQEEPLEQKKDKSLHRFYKPPHFIKNVKVQRAMSLAWGIFAILASGTLYGFSTISNEVRDTLGYSQTDIALAISMGDVGMYIGLTVGFFFDYFGPFYTNGLATILYVVGCTGVWALVQGHILNSVGLLSFFLFLIGQSSYATFTACVVANVHNYTITHRGKISGVLVGMFALSAAVFSLIYKFFFQNDLGGYLLFMAILLSIVSLIATYIVRLVRIEGVEEPETLDDEKKEKNPQADEIVEKQIQKISKDEESNLGSSNNSIGDNKSKLLFVLNGSSSSVSSSSSTPSESSTNSNSNSTISQINPIDTTNPNFLDGKRDVTGLKLLKMIEFWGLWIIYFFAGGLSIMFLNNIAIMAESLKESDSIHSNLVIVFAIGNLVGRVGMGFLSDLISKKVSRFWCVVLSSLILTLTHLICAFELKPLLYPATILTGIGYGAIVSIMVLMASFRFGPRRFGLNFGFLALSSASGSLIFSTVSSKIYDGLSESSVDGKCYGNHCFQVSFLMSFALNLFSVFVGLFLIFYTKKTDKKELNKKN
ncbi:hypothetical protein RB653_007347 [Dictyostelium firmibasis]|uniref:Nodulin-like domain-containing protein n=1 Tax=Dictyostelium firmibasis TaxID=79012 RepID=A0AAN7TUF5_9MYCE